MADIMLIMTMLERLIRLLVVLQLIVSLSWCCLAYCILDVFSGYLITVIFIPLILLLKPHFEKRVQNLVTISYKNVLISFLPFVVCHQWNPSFNCGRFVFVSPHCRRN